VSVKKCRKGGAQECKVNGRKMRACSDAKDEFFFFSGITMNLRQECIVKSTKGRKGEVKVCKKET
jgi:hypothetical protein